MSLSETGGKYPFEFMSLPKRPTKPRDTGITMVEGDAFFCVLGERVTEDLMEWAGDWIDWFKFGISTMRFQPRELVKRKIEILKRNKVEIFPGGVFFEKAIMQNKVKPFLKEAKEVGCTGLEISDSQVTLAIDQKVDLLKQAKEYGLNVLGEVGGESGAIEQIEAYLKAGAFKVILHGEALPRELLLKRENEEAEAGIKIMEIARSVGAENIIFEVPIGHWLEINRAIWWFISKFGPNVNLGNVSPNHILMVEQMRTGYQYNSFGKIPPL